MKRYFHAIFIYFLFLFCFSFSKNNYSISGINEPITFYPRFNLDGLGTFKSHFLLENSDNDLVLEYRNKGPKNLGYTIGADIIFQKTKWINFGGCDPKSVRRFIECRAEKLKWNKGVNGPAIIWEGKGIKEIGRRSDTNQIVIKIDPRKSSNFPPLSHRYPQIMDED